MNQVSATTFRRAIVTAGCCAAAGLLAACGSATPSASPAATVTVTVPATQTAAASPGSQTPVPAQAGPPACGTPALTASLGSGNGAAGSTYYAVDFTNNSGSACGLYGYPGVSFVTAAGSQVGAAATEDPTYPRQLVTLAPGATAHATLRVVEALNYPASTCHPVTVQRIRVFPPNQTTSLSISLAATACTNASLQILSVQTVQPGK
jgi:hypothetical protein